MRKVTRLTCEVGKVCQINQNLPDLHVHVHILSQRLVITIKIHVQWKKRVHRFTLNTLVKTCTDYCVEDK